MVYRLDNSIISKSDFLISIIVQFDNNFDNYHSVREHLDSWERHTFRDKGARCVRKIIIMRRERVLKQMWQNVSLLIGVRDTESFLALFSLLSCKFEILLKSKVKPFFKDIALKGMNRFPPVELNVIFPQSLCRQVPGRGQLRPLYVPWGV